MLLEREMSVICYWSDGTYRGIPNGLHLFRATV